MAQEISGREAFSRFPVPENAALPRIVESIEKQKIKEVLEKHKTQRKAAKALGITERMLGYKISKYGL